MTTAAASLVTTDSTEPAQAPKDDGVLYDPEDDLLPPAKPADRNAPAPTGTTTLVLVTP